MTTNTMADHRPVAGHNPRENGTVDDTDLHHLFDLIRDDHVRFTRWQHTDLTGASIDDLVYAAEEAGLVTIHPEGVIKPTEKGRQWRSHNHRPPQQSATHIGGASSAQTPAESAAVPAVLFQTAGVA